MRGATITSSTPYRQPITIRCMEFLTAAWNNWFLCQTGRSSVEFPLAMLTPMAILIRSFKNAKPNWPGRWLPGEMSPSQESANGLPTISSRNRNLKNTRQMASTRFSIQKIFCRRWSDVGQAFYTKPPNGTIQFFFRGRSTLASRQTILPNWRPKSRSRSMPNTRLC